MGRMGVREKKNQIKKNDGGETSEPPRPREVPRRPSPPTRRREDGYAHRLQSLASCTLRVPAAPRRHPQASTQPRCLPRATPRSYTRRRTQRRSRSRLWGVQRVSGCSSRHSSPRATPIHTPPPASTRLAGAFEATKKGVRNVPTVQYVAFLVRGVLTA